MTDVPRVDVFTAGVCNKKTGHGGYAAIVKDGRKQTELAGGFQPTTTERMELMAIIVGLEALPAPCQVSIYSDLVYSVDLKVKGLPKTLDANYWTLSGPYGEPDKRRQGANDDLSGRLLALCTSLAVAFEWRQGHGGQNEIHRCDVLANGWAQQTGLPRDEGHLR